MTNQELATCAVEGIPVKIAIINNGNLGMVRQWQTLFYNERYSNTDLDRVARTYDEALSHEQPPPRRDPAAGGGTRRPRLRQARRGLRVRGAALRGRSRAWTR